MLTDKYSCIVELFDESGGITRQGVRVHVDNPFYGAPQVIITPAYFDPDRQIWRDSIDGRPIDLGAQDALHLARIITVAATVALGGKQIVEAQR